MEFYTHSDKYIAKELGHRIKALRLQKNITQKELAEAATLSLNSIKFIESGRGKLSSLIAVLRELDALDHLNNFIPEISISPIQLAKMQGRVRKRASGQRLKSQTTDESEW